MSAERPAANEDGVEAVKWLIHYREEGRACLDGALGALESGDTLQATLLAGHAKSALALAAMYEREPVNQAEAKSDA